jgi:hypothetical protein
MHEFTYTRIQHFTRIIFLYKRKKIQYSYSFTYMLLTPKSKYSSVSSNIIIRALDRLLDPVLTFRSLVADLVRL